MKNLSPRQREVYEFICWHVSEKSRPPTFADIAKHLSISNKRALDICEELRRKEYVTWIKNQARTLEVLK